jgi:hypothetical protein
LKLEVRYHTASGFDKYALAKKVENLKYFREFPWNVPGDFTNLKSFGAAKENLKNNIREAGLKLEQMEKVFNAENDSLKQVINALRSQADSDSTGILRLESRIAQRNSDYSRWKDDTTYDIQKMEFDLGLISRKMIQLPLAFLFVIIWISVFGGMIIAVYLGYQGHVYYELYSLKEDGKPTYLCQISDEAKAKDTNCLECSYSHKG